MKIYWSGGGFVIGGRGQQHADPKLITAQREKNVSDSRRTFRPLTAIKVRTLGNVAVGSENQLHVLDNALEGEGR